MWTCSGDLNRNKEVRGPVLFSAVPSMLKFILPAAARALRPGLEEMISAHFRAVSHFKVQYGNGIPEWNFHFNFDVNAFRH
mmetsp:Transcript_7804/g.12951  ORF Transcript_7804/g.12951 Transcript_7804/m.12951 type:complete len:81 (+) Transcript_7804:1429-1671(+)